jgi:hypothetical protein
MKKVLIFLSFALLILASSCKKTGEQNPLADIKNLGVGSYPTLVSNGNLNFNYNVPTSKVDIKIDKYGEDIDKIDLFVVEGANSDPAKWKKIKSIPFTGTGTALSATSQEVATALGVSLTSLSPGNFYTFYNRAITKDGKIYDLSNVGSALGSNSNYNACFQWTAYITCPFSGPVGGSYKVVYDGDWQDWSTGDVVQVTDGPAANQINLSQVWPNASIPGASIVKPLLVNIDPATGTAKVPLVTFANYGSLATAQGSGSGDVAGYVFSCTGYITLTMNVTYNGSPQGALKLKLQKL